jgi:Na+/H+ antiporter NhaD/arsenite permease-like protein
MSVYGIPVDFILFGLTLLGVAAFHRRTLLVAAAGAAVILAYKLAFTGIAGAPGLEGLGLHMAHQWVELANLALLLLGFSLLSRHFELSRLPDLAPDILPSGWIGGLALLAIVFVLSAFLDNIASALIGATIAAHVYRKNVHLAYLAAIVAAANAGGAGSVLGDTTTTMIWIAGKSPLDVLHAYVGAIVAFVIVAVPAAMLQERRQPILEHDIGGIRADWTRVGIVVFMLAAAVGANVASHILAPALLHAIPVIGLGLWAALLLAAPVRAPDWAALPEAARGTAFLLSLVFAASLMPVESLPAPSWPATFGLGAVSAVFDNIPLTALALKQGGYDWGVLAYAVGFGGSMIWFGSSAGVAAANVFPEARSTVNWLKAAWFVPLGYAIGFFALIAIMGWRPHL